LAEPVLESGRSDRCVVAGDEGAVVERCAEVARAAVGRHPACVAVRAQHAAGELVEAEPFGACQLDGAVHRRAHRRDRQRGRDVVGRLRLNEHGRDTNRLAVGVRIGDPADELEELRRADDRVGHGCPLDRFLLGELGPEVPAVGQPVGADDRQGHVVADTEGRFCGEDVAGRGLEELQHRCVAPSRCVRHVDDNPGGLERFGQSLAGQRVDARVGRRRERLVAGLAQLLDELGSDEAGSADHDDLHRAAPLAITSSPQPPTG
jgi:hypothetical protein